jgi:hypothetical protein
MIELAGLDAGVHLVVTGHGHQYGGRPSSAAGNRRASSPPW